MNADEGKNGLSDADRVLVLPASPTIMRKEFKQYAGADVPIFGAPRIVPTFHGVGPVIFAADPKTGELSDAGKKFAKWLDAHPDRPWAGMMNYAADRPIGEKGVQTFQKYRDRYVGSIAGESLGYFSVDPKKMKAATAAATTRRQLVAAMTPLEIEANRAKYRTVYGKDLRQPVRRRDFVCRSPTLPSPCSERRGCRTGYESATAVVGAEHVALCDLAAGRLTHPHSPCRNFGDSSTIFSNQRAITRHRIFWIIIICFRRRDDLACSTSGTSTWPGRRCSTTSRVSTNFETGRHHRGRHPEVQPPKGKLVDFCGDL